MFKFIEDFAKNKFTIFYWYILKFLEEDIFIKKETYIKNNMSIVKDEEEKRIYENEKENFDKQIKFLRKELENLDDIERNDIIELKIFIDMLNNAKNITKKLRMFKKEK